MPRSEIVRKKSPQRKSASTLVFSVIFLAVVLSFATVLFERSTANRQSTGQRVDDQESVRIAEAGIEKAVWCLNNPSNTTDCPGNPSFTGESSIDFGRGEYTSTVSGSGNSRTIDVTATIAGSPEQHLQIKLSTTTTNVAFQYGVQTGIGGITLENNAYVQGNVYAGGSITGSNGSYITGDVILTASDPTLDQTSDPSGSTTVDFGTNGSTNDWLAQSFVPSMTERVYSIDLKIARVNSPSGNLTAYIYSDALSNPGSDLSNGGKQITVALPSSATSGWENGWTNQVFTPSTNPILTAGTTYWLVIRSSSTNASNFWRSIRSTTDATYADGTAKLDGDGSSMPAACSPACDIAFRLNLGGIQPTLNLPSVQGNGRAYNMTSTTIDQKAYYRNLSGTVRANSSDTCTDGENGPNCFDLDTTGGTDPSPANFPISDAQITQMEGQADEDTTDCPSGCTVSSGSIGPMKYDGDVTINGTVTLAGTVWVKGNLTLSTGAVIRLSNSYGSNSGVIIADNPDNVATSGRIIAGNDSALARNSNADTYIMGIATSTSLDTNSPAFLANNNFSKASITPDAAAVMYVPHGMAKLQNNTELKEITAHSLYLSQNAFVVYETGLASVEFSSGPGGSWIYQKGSYQIIE